MNLRRVLGKGLKGARWASAYVRFRLNRAPIIVLGNQKSGTSAIAHLLADCCGLTKRVDTPIVWERIADLASGSVSLESLARRAPEQFMTDLIKEPHLTFALAHVRRLFPRASYVFVVRDPRDNIRSILDRLNLRGDIPTVSADGTLPPGWRSVLFHGATLSDEVGLNHVRSLAVRWRDAAHVYFRVREQIDDVHLVRYEDFLEGKGAYIRELAERLGRDAEYSISDRVDVQYQPRGRNRGVEWETYYSDDNLRLIESLCGPEMRRLGYPPTREPA